MAQSFQAARTFLILVIEKCFPRESAGSLSAVGYGQEQSFGLYNVFPELFSASHRDFAASSAGAEGGGGGTNGHANRSASRVLQLGQRFVNFEMYVLASLIPAKESGGGGGDGFRRSGGLLQRALPLRGTRFIGLSPPLSLAVPGNCGYSAKYSERNGRVTK